VLWFIGGSFCMMSLIGSVVRSFEPHHPALILATFALMGLTALGYIMCGRSYSKWLEARKTSQGIRNCIEGAKHGWKSPVTGITYPKHPRTSMQGPADEWHHED